MTEAEWLECTDTPRLLGAVYEKTSNRLLRLFVCACCRQRWYLLTDERSRQAVEVAERFADGLANEKALRKAKANAVQVVRAGIGVNFVIGSEDAASAAWDDVWWAAHRMASQPLNAPNRVLRHIIGNPFRPYPPSASWPPVVLSLAMSLYAGEPCHEPLHDALLEANHPLLAEHFREDWHPRGCWALDLILGTR